MTTVEIKMQNRQMLLTVILGAFTAMMSVTGFFVVRTLHSVEDSINQGTKSINELNVTVKGVIVDMSHQRRDIDRHEIEIKEIKSYIFDRK